MYEIKVSETTTILFSTTDRARHHVLYVAGLSSRIFAPKLRLKTSNDAGFYVLL